MNRKGKFSIEEIISDEMIVTCYQPMVSIKRKQVIGYEAFSRGTGKGHGEAISPDILLSEAEKYGLVLDLDRLFRKKSLENYREYHAAYPGFLLSINMESSAIRTGLGSKHFLKAVEKSGIDPSCIIIEVMESEFEDITPLAEFVSNYRPHGFMVAMTGLGADFSNWDRIIKLRPDLIKLDMSVIRDIDSDVLNQEVVRSLVKLSHNTGSLVVAEGIETENEALKVLELNADVLQGFFLSMPIPADDLKTANATERIEDVSASYREARNRRLRAQEKDLREFDSLTDHIIKEIKDGDTLPGEVVKNTAYGLNGIECIYILDECGIQVSETVVNPDIRSYRKSRIFHPDNKFSDQSNKEYYFNLVNGQDRFISEPYISGATGNMCITISKKYTGREGKRRILCIDIKK